MLLLNIQGMNAQLDAFPVADISDWQYLLESAEEQSIPILLVFSDPSSEICRNWEAEMEDVDIFQRLMRQQFLVARPDLATYAGEQLIESFSVDFMPAIIGLDPTGNAVMRAMGNMEEAEWVRSLRLALSRSREYDRLMRAWEKDSLRHDGYCACAEIFALNRRWTEADVAGFKCVSSMSPAVYLESRYRDLIFTYGLDAGMAVLPFFLDQENSIRKNHPEFPIDEFFLEAYRFNLELSVMDKDSLRLAFILEHLLPAIQGADTPDSLKTLLLFIESNENWLEWGRNFEQAIQSDTTISARESLDEVRANHESDSVFLKWFEGYLLSSPPLEPYDQTYLLAWTYYRQGELNKAKSLLPKAMALANSSGRERECKQLDMFIRFAIRQR